MIPSRIRFALFLTSVLFLAGCGIRLSQGQAEQLAQARADVVASRAATDQSAANELLRASAARQMAAVANLDLPEPLTPATALVAPDGTAHAEVMKQEAKAAKEAEESPPESWSSNALAWGCGTGLLVLGALRFSPGLFGVLANIAHQTLAPLATRQMREREQQAGQIAEQAIAYGAAVTETAKQAGLGEQVNVIQVAAAEVQDRLGIREQTKAILSEFKAKKA